MAKKKESTSFSLNTDIAKATFGALVIGLILLVVAFVAEGIFRATGTNDMWLLPLVLILFPVTWLAVPIIAIYSVFAAVSCVAARRRVAAKFYIMAIATAVIYESMFFLTQFFFPN